MGDKNLLSCTKSGVKIIPADENDASPLTLPEPTWIPDKQIQSCSLCQTKFDLFNRKHHCRRCGTCICRKCCHNRPLPRMCFIDPVLQCNLCSLVSTQEDIFFDEHLKYLQQGSVLNVMNYDVSDDNVKAVPMFCRLSRSQREILFQCEKKQTVNVIEPILLSEIKEMIKISSHKHSNITGIKLLYDNASREHQTCTMKVSPTSPQQHHQLQWLDALLKAFELVQETKKLMPAGNTIEIQE
ncbi:hypothetical protein HELRODRAFT_188563 [Helobdella robusta]|uniref:FYVE-type domain-containing protein n=1 Tax=Helobdella robusta TaxID=6412 RepID=T1FQ46_HELRO|nr:hypothetical protein HELRODRAFT_188563 [Helobdella robusta]ESO02065.1 hypothetical protein HELRODRAFT_188563 [Helobdella robusta]